MYVTKFAFFIDNTLKRLQKIFDEKFFAHFKSKKNILDHFHKLYYDSKKQTRKNTFFLGIITFKCPLDLWIYQEIIFDLKPDIIIECGTAAGGSALFLALICDSLKKGKIITIDIEEKDNRPKHKRITYLSGSSTSKEIVEKVQSFIGSKDEIVVILDSDHHKDHVLRELEIYSKFVTKGSYIIVEDTNISGHPVRPKFGPGPMEAVKEFLKDNKDFIIDKSREKFFLTFNPNGYLKKIP
jgi:cephalosporin hydroxylase